MLISADWVLPIDGPPIRHGAVHVHSARIVAVGPVDRFEGEALAQRADFPGCVITPGLVNAHTHLSLTALAGLLEPADFPTWLSRVVPMMRTLDEDGLVASASRGAAACLQSGVTVVGDVTYGPESLAASADLGLGGVFFWEVLGVPAGELPRVLAATEFPQAQNVRREGRTRVGLSAHAAYTCGPELLRAVAEYARANGYPLAIHVAESDAETSLVLDGHGPLAPVAQRLADGFEPAHASPVAYLARLGVLDDAVAVHCVHLAKGDAETLRDRARGVVVCPRSNAFLRNGEPPIAQLVANKLTLGIGTDSLASNTDLDLFAEARAVSRLAPAVPPERILRMMTLEGAATLGLESRCGSLTPGKHADLAIVRLPDSDDPVATLLETGASSRVRAVMAAGVWRVRDGRPVFGSKSVDAAVSRAAAKARAARPA